MYYFILLQKEWSWLFSPDQSEALGGALAPIANSVGRSEAPKALNESHRSLPQGKPAAESNNHNTEKIPDYRGFPVLLNRNWHLIWILQVKIHKSKEKNTLSDDIKSKKIRLLLKKIKFILDVFNLFFVTVIAWHLELPWIFKDSRNFPDWWDTIKGFIDI